MDNDRELAEAARLDLETRGSREALFGSHMFTEFGWNMLLALFIAQVDGVTLKHASLYKASHIDATTGRRWILYLESQGMVTRNRDGDVSLTARSSERMRIFLRRLARQIAA